MPMPSRRSAATIDSFGDDIVVVKGRVGAVESLEARAPVCRCGVCVMS
jgi:hypothetical protein